MPSLSPQRRKERSLSKPPVRSRIFLAGSSDNPPSPNSFNHEQLDKPHTFGVTDPRELERVHALVKGQQQSGVF